MNLCKICLINKLETDFHKHPKSKSGLQYICKTCKYILNLKRKNSDRAKYLWIRAKSRAKQKGLIFNIMPQDIIIPEKCPLLDVVFDTNRYSPSLDRIDNTKGYTKDNIQVISRLANTIKLDCTKTELFTFCTNYLSG